MLFRFFKMILLFQNSVLFFQILLFRYFEIVLVFFKMLFRYFEIVFSFFRIVISLFRNSILNHDFNFSFVTWNADLAEQKGTGAYGSVTPTPLHMGLLLIDKINDQ